MKNGKKFTQRDIELHTKYPDKIVCALEDHDEVLESVINEELNEPHLLQLAKQLKDNPVMSGGFSNFNQIFGKMYYKSSLSSTSSKSRDHYSTFEVPFDEIDSSNVKEYNKIDDNCKKAVRSIISSSHARGMVLLRDYDHKYVCVIGYRKEVFVLDKDWNSLNTANLTSYNWQDATYSKIMSLLDYAQSVVVISWDDEFEYKAKMKQTYRSNAQAGVILNTPEQNEMIAKENQRRYKKLAAQLKVQKDKDFAQIDQKVENIVINTLRISQKAKQDTNKYNVYDVSYLNSLIYGVRHEHYSKNHKLLAYGENGLLFCYDMFTKYYIRTANDSRYLSDINMYKRFKQELLVCIKNIEEVLRGFGVYI